MKTQRGMVKYKNRTDIECMYYVTDAGIQFYSLDASGKKLKNGNIIVSSVLVEAIDPMAKASHIGVIDAEGNEIIPCNNKSIREIDDNILIVEVAEPTSQAVIDALSLRSDPLSATKLVSTTADVKERLNTKMGSNGRFLFNDLFSEAALYDIDGNQIVDGYYSFIGIADRKLYMSKNTADSEIVEYSILPPEVQNDNLAEDSRETLDVTAVDVSSDTVENALNSYDGEVVSDNSGVGDAEPETLESTTADPVVSEDGGVSNDINNQESESLQSFDSLTTDSQTVENYEVANSVDELAMSEINSEVGKVVPEPESLSENGIENAWNPAEYEGVVPEPSTEEPQNEEIVSLDEEPVGVEDPIMALFGENYQDNIEQSPELDSSFRADSLADFDLISDDSEMVDTFKKFIEQAKRDKEQNRKYKEQIKAFDIYKRKMEARLHSNEQEVINLRSEKAFLEKELAAKTKETEEFHKLIPAIKEVFTDDEYDDFDSSYGYKKVA